MMRLNEFPTEQELRVMVAEVDQVMRFVNQQLFSTLFFRRFYVSTQIYHNVKFRNVPLCRKCRLIKPLGHLIKVEFLYI